MAEISFQTAECAVKLSSWLTSTFDLARMAKPLALITDMICRATPLAVASGLISARVFSTIEGKKAFISRDASAGDEEPWKALRVTSRPNLARKLHEESKRIMVTSWEALHVGHALMMQRCTSNPIFYQECRLQCAITSSTVQRASERASQATKSQRPSLVR